MIKLSDLINAAANQREWKPLDRKEKEKPIVLPTSTSYVNFLDKENNRAVIKKEEDKKKLTHDKNASINTPPLRKISFLCDGIGLMCLYPHCLGRRYHMFVAQRTPPVS